ncbi:MAG: hypothetical protein HOP12_14895 [Candidatus Eisenbacteria bacterium]|uniref:Uncharacterized protein n=1 Tax=Eiseniibacteriota bacterium TaxID=2212470 RepID=A0A849SVN8_UNCEI|nr:hypothetical protein [Candidatus Eisenbacteria bacterium]
MTAKQPNSRETFSSWPARAGVLVAILIFGVVVWRIFVDTRPRPQLVKLVERIREDIKQVNQDHDSWQIEEARLEINFAVKVRSDTEFELKAAGSGTLSSENEQSQKLVILLRRSDGGTGREGSALVEADTMGVAGSN